MTEGSALGNRAAVEKPATEQPGNSFKYLYWRLSEKQFQQLCSALLRKKYDPVQCYPVGMADGGIDAIAEGSTIYQVKWTSKMLQKPATWLRGAIEGERKNIERLIKEKRITRYILMTSVAGTTSSEDAGSIQELEADLVRLSADLGVSIECWWQSDIDAEVDNALDSTKWAYQEMLAGSDAIHYLIHGAQVEGEAAQMRDTMLQVMATQWREDSKLKFSQLDLENSDVSDLFVDVHANLIESPRYVREDRSKTPRTATRGPVKGAVQFLLRTSEPLTFLLGVPGQGKSTLGQYLSQIHRSALLPGKSTGALHFEDESGAEPKLPLRVDLRDYASWMAGLDPFDDQNSPASAPRIRGKNRRGLEQFLAEFCSAASGGRPVTVVQIQSLMQRYPLLLVLDGLDEVPSAELRKLVVQEIDTTAARMASTIRFREFQIVVTSRPNATGLSEPDRDIFQTVRLQPLSSRLQDDFLDKWCAINAISGARRSRLRRIFNDRRAHDHIAQLADNPMQLTILLSLIRKKGEAVPVQRTSLYTDYMETLLDREVERKQIERGDIPRVKEVTAFLGWHVHAGVEADPAAVRLTRDQIEANLVLYFHFTDGPISEAKSLLSSASERFWAMTSKFEGTLEFVVQPVREYFAAKYLAEWAGYSKRIPLAKQDVLSALIERSYWLNTARFYAGFASPNELAGLRYGLEESIGAARHPLQTRIALWTLLADGIFVNASAIQRDVTSLLLDDISTALVGSPQNDDGFQTLSSSAGGLQLAEALMKSLLLEPGAPLARLRVRIIRHRLSFAPEAFREWWVENLRSRLGTAAEATWLGLGEAYGVTPLLEGEVSSLQLDSSESAKAALGVGYSPSNDSEGASKLLTAVLAGWCSDTSTASFSEAGSLLGVLRPQWYHQLVDDLRSGPTLLSKHQWMTKRDRDRRATPWSRLIAIDRRYEALKTAANARSSGKKGTTEPWQLPARELTRIHGPSWLASEIAIAGAASWGTVASGSIDPHGVPFGPDVDYGTFVIDVHKGPNASWWASTFDLYSDQLSRRTWSLAMLATAGGTIISQNLERIDSILAGLSEDDFRATASSSSRLGLTQTHRRIDPSVWEYAATMGPRTQLLVSHFVSDLRGSDALAGLSDTDLSNLASAEAACWPVLHAVTTRMLRAGTPELLEALSKFGADAPIEISVSEVPIADEFIGAILSAPAGYPLEWILTCERWRAVSNDEIGLESAAVENGWVPKIPHG